MKDNDFFFGTETDNMDIKEYLKRINDITKYYFEKCEKYKKDFIFVALLG